MITPGEFRTWLEGYLDGKDGLTAEQSAKILAKAGQITEGIQYFPYNYPWIYIEKPQLHAPYWQYTTCMGKGTAVSSGTLTNSEVEVRYA